MEFVLAKNNFPYLISVLNLKNTMLALTYEDIDGLMYDLLNTKISVGNSLDNTFNIAIYILATVVIIILRYLL